jgi:hypothetical protein
MSTSYRWKLLAFFSFLIHGFSFSQSLTYYDLYESQCDFAEAFYKENKNEFEQSASSIGTTAAFLYAIVAPELTQFSYLKNAVENHSLKVFYVQGGKGYSNFSVGYFQMKPSFVEELENAIGNSTNLKRSFEFCLMENPNERSARVTRLKRLETLEWQMIYLQVFYKLVDEKFRDMHFKNVYEKLCYFAAAYNSGFNKSIEDLKLIQTKRMFPYFSDKKFNYSDLSCGFYRRAVSIE